MQVSSEHNQEYAVCSRCNNRAVVQNGMFLYGEAMDAVISYHDVELTDDKIRMWKLFLLIGKYGT